MNITISINEQYTLYKGNVTNSNFVGSVILFVINACIVDQSLKLILAH